MTSPDAADPLGLVGTTIADKYAVEAVVGEGGFAVVYRAMHAVWKRPVAVKVFKALGEVPNREREQLLADFIQEGALLADLSERSAAIVQARDVGMLKTPRGEEVPYMVLEWLEGKALEDILVEDRAQGRPPRSLAQVARLLEPVAEALALAHKKGIAHRDVKPANVFVLGDPRAESPSVKLLDFGIAKVVQDAQKIGFGKTAGHITSFTPLYGAPEQFDRGYGATGPWTDVFALALVFAEVASGREPMNGDNLVQLAYASADPQKRPTPRGLGVTTSDAVEAVFRKAVAIKVTDRYQTVGEFWTAVRAAVLGEGALASLKNTGPDPNASTMTPEDLARASQGEIRAFGATGAPSANAQTAMGNTGPGMPPAFANTAAPPQSSKLGLVVGAALGVAVLGGGGVFLATRGKGPPILAASASASAPPPAASAPVGASTSCPAGMVYVPGGSFFMGSEAKDALPDEKPPHKVTLSPFCIDVYEVTVAKYKECSDGGRCRRPGRENVWPNITPAQQKIYDPLCNFQDVKKKADHPINCVDYEQSREYCEAQGGRLPTEAEWEFAALGPDGRLYPWGDEPPSAELLNACGKECVAWMSKHPDPDSPPHSMFDGDDKFENTAPVGSFPKGKSRFGLHDVVGNVWEWVADWHGPYAAAPSTDPKGPEKATDRVIRGGAWNGSQPSWVRPSFRFSSTPDRRSYAIGFRCAATPGGPRDR